MDKRNETLLCILNLNYYYYFRDLNAPHGYRMTMVLKVQETT